VQSQLELSRDGCDGLSGAGLALREAGTRTGYLETTPDPTFVTVHVPASVRRGATGVVLCPPLGWSELCTHRSRRAWANALADAGHPAIRLDLPGTGDSAGSLQSPGRLGAWTSAVAAATCWLRDEFGCSRICGLGIGFGGMLAWLALAEGAPIDDLILWGTPLRGSQLVRELRVAARVDIDWRVRPDRAVGEESVAPSETHDGGLLDEAGQVITRETLDSLAAIDLREIPLPDPERRRVLFFHRADVKVDEDLGQHLRAIGVRTTVESGDGYNAMMRYVQLSVVPRGAIEDSIEWLSAAATSAAWEDTSNGRLAAPVRSVTRVEINQDGVEIRETPVTIELSGEERKAVITAPVDLDASNLCVTFFSGGSDRRIGPNRLWVDMARCWAARGFTAVRVDPPGLGDSDGDESAWGQPHAHYDTREIERANELLTALESRGLASRFLLVGFCSGAYRSLHAAVKDPRVVGVFAIDLPFFRWTWWTVNIRDSWLVAREPREGDSALKLKIIYLLQRCLRIVNMSHRALVALQQFFPNRGEQIINELTARDTELLFILKRSSYAHEQLLRPRHRARLRRNRRVQVKSLFGEDQLFRPLVSQRFVRGAMDEALTRVAGAQTVAVPAAVRRDPGAA
jgi:pimeloyl-ACP methyl ester carboxylesterase